MSIQFWCFGTCCPVWRYSIGLLFQLEFWKKDRAILKLFWMFFVCFHPFSNKVKIVHLRAGCFLKLNLDNRWKLSFYFRYYWIQWTRQKYWNFFFQIYINFSAVSVNKISIFYLVDKSKIFKFTMYYTNYFLVESFVSVFALICVRCPVGKVLFAGRLSVLLQCRLVAFVFWVESRVG
jgi:hypothetical protein